MRKYLLIIALVFMALPLFAQRGDLDEETQPIGLEHFNITDITLKGHSETFKLIDLNNDGTKEIVYIQIETLSLEILYYDNDISGYRLQQTIRIQPGTAIISIGNYLPAEGKEIAFYTSEGIFCYSPVNAAVSALGGQGWERKDIVAPLNIGNEIKPLVTEETIFFPSENPRQNNAVGMPVQTPRISGGGEPGRTIPILQEGEDINNDGIDDLIIPTKDGYLICWGPYEDNKPARKQVINQPSAQSIRTTDSSFITISSSLPHISLKDLNGNGLKDIVLGFPNRFANLTTNKLNYYLQDKTNGFFPETPSGEFRLDFLSLPTNKSGSNVLLYSNQFADINTDGFMDLVIASTSGDLSDIGNMVTRIFIFLGNRGGHPIYSTPPTQVINIKGVCPLWGITEINSDNYPDLFITSFKVSLASNIKKAILRYIPITYQIYLNKPAKNFPMASDYERNVNFPASALGKGTGYFSHIYFGYDFNNDSRTDLLTISGPEKKKGVVTIYCGRQKDKLTRPDGISFEKDEFLLYPVRIPDKAIVVDLNNDKKNDIILQYKSKLTILIAK